MVARVTRKSLQPFSPRIQQGCWEALIMTIWSSPSNIHCLFDSASRLLDSFALQKIVSLMSEQCFHILGVDHGRPFTIFVVFAVVNCWFWQAGIHCGASFVHDSEVCVGDSRLVGYMYQVPEQAFLNICTHKIRTISMYLWAAHLFAALAVTNGPIQMGFAHTI